MMIITSTEWPQLGIICLDFTSSDTGFKLDDIQWLYMVDNGDAVIAGLIMATPQDIISLHRITEAIQRSLTTEKREEKTMALCLGGRQWPTVHS
jgi:hypothetical protein